MPESLPEISDCDDVSQAVETHGDDPAMRRYILREAIDKGCVDCIPDDWGIEVKTDGRGTEDNNSSGGQ